MVFALHQHELAINIQVSPTSWTPFPPSSPPHSSRLSQSTSFGFGFPVSYIRLPLAIYFAYGNVYISILFFKLLHFCPAGNTSKWTCPAGFCCCSVAKSCLTLCDPMDCSTPHLPVLHHLSCLPMFMFIESCSMDLVEYIGDAIQWFHLLLLPSISPSNRVFTSDSVLCIK